jgi:hypothetical protein
MPPEQNVVRELLLAELRCVSHRMKTAEAEINFIGQALKAGALSCEDAMKSLDDTGWMALCDPLIMSKLRAAYIDG